MTVLRDCHIYYCNNESLKKALENSSCKWLAEVNEVGHIGWLRLRAYIACASVAPRFYFAVVICGLLFVSQSAQAALAWGKGPYFEATYQPVTCSATSQPGYTYTYGETCRVLFPFFNVPFDTSGKFYFSDDAPGLMLFESGPMREVRSVQFKSTDAEFGFSRPGGLVPWCGLPIVRALQHRAARQFGRGMKSATVTSSA